MLERLGNWRSGNWRRRLIVLFLAAGMAFSVKSQHKVRNDVMLLAIGSALWLANGFWVRHELRQQGIDPDADDIADTRKEVRNIVRSRPDLAPRRKGEIIGI